MEMERLITEETVNVLYTGDVELDLTVSYEAIHRKEGLEFAGFDVTVFNHNGNVIKLDVVDWEVGEGRFFNDFGIYEEKGVVISDIRLSALVDITEENEVVAQMALQYMLNDLTITKIDVNAHANDGTVTSIGVDNFSFSVGRTGQ